MLRWVLLLQFVIIPLVGIIAKALGFYLLTFYGIPHLLQGLESSLQGHLHNVPANILQILYLFGFDTGIKLIFGAYGTAFTFRGVSGSISRWVTRRPVI